MKNRIYKYRIYMSRREYHLHLWEILNDMLNNETDPIERRRLYSRRSNQRRLYRKYEATAKQLWE